MKHIQIDKLHGKKRLWQQVGLSSSKAGTMTLTLDGRVIATPSGVPLSCPTRTMAETVRAEWQAVEGVCTLDRMPLTRLLATAVEAEADSALFHRLMDEMVSYAHDDVLFYRAAHPVDLVHRQDQVWTPLLDWAYGILGVPCRVTPSVMPIRQDDAFICALEDVLRSMTSFDFSAFQMSARGCQSLIVGLAVVRGHITPDMAFDAAFLDELYQSDLWGADELAAQRRTGVRADLTHAVRFAVLARGEALQEDYSCAVASL